MKKNYNIENYLKLDYFEHRKIIAKLRCSDHTLEIEKGRHRNMERSDRLCKQCNDGSIETEAHFLLGCRKYNTLKQNSPSTDKSYVKWFVLFNFSRLAGGRNKQIYYAIMYCIKQEILSSQ